MNRRTFLGSAIGTVGIVGVTRRITFAQSTPSSGSGEGAFPELTIQLKDDGFVIDNPIQAGRYKVTVSNIGTSTASHFGLGKIPDDVTDEQYQSWLKNPDVEVGGLSFDTIGFVGVPDWPQPNGGDKTGIIDLPPGRYFLFDPFDARGMHTIMVEGEFGSYDEPASDLTVTLKEMSIDLPDAAHTSNKMRWKIENIGAFAHETAVIPVSADFTEDTLKTLMELPDDATPPPGVPDLVYQPTAAIGVLGSQHTTWLDVQLEPGRYLGICMLPFGTGYPHAMDGMYTFFDVS